MSCRLRVNHAVLADTVRPVLCIECGHPLDDEGACSQCAHEEWRQDDLAAKTHLRVEDVPDRGPEG
jgi:hypothetical protein